MPRFKERPTGRRIPKPKMPMPLSDVELKVLVEQETRRVAVGAIGIMLLFGSVLCGLLWVFFKVAPTLKAPP